MRIRHETELKLTETVRDSSIDILKSFGMIFVFIGHMGHPQGGFAIVSYVYSFHMGLFFFVSGYLSNSNSDIKFTKYLKKKTISLIVPYLFFFLFSFLWTNTVYLSSHGSEIFSANFTWKNFFLALILSGGYLEKIPLNNFPLWFLPLCFISSIVFYPFYYLKNRVSYMLILLIVIGALTIPFQLLYTGRPAFHINVLPAALFYMIAGYLFKFYKDKCNNQIFANSIVAILLCVAGYILSLRFNGAINQINTYFYFLGSLASIIGYYVISLLISSKILAYIGKNSLYIFAVHQLIILEIPAIGILTHLQKRGVDGVLLYVCYVVSAVIMTILLVQLLLYGKTLIKTLFFSIMRIVHNHKSEVA